MIFRLKFEDKTEFAQAKDKQHLVESYEKEYEDDFKNIQEITEVPEEEAKTIMLKNNEYDEENPGDMPKEFSLFDASVGEDFEIIGSTDWD